MRFLLRSRDGWGAWVATPRIDSQSPGLIMPMLRVQAWRQRGTIRPHSSAQVCSFLKRRSPFSHRYSSLGGSGNVGGWPHTSILLPWYSRHSATRLKRLPAVPPSHHHEVGGQGARCVHCRHHIRHCCLHRLSSESVCETEEESMGLRRLVHEHSNCESAFTTRSPRVQY